MRGRRDFLYRLEGSFKNAIIWMGSASACFGFLVVLTLTLRGSMVRVEDPSSLLRAYESLVDDVFAALMVVPLEKGVTIFSEKA
mmetsp:Transcript_119818/g.335532  ORF Transcript_119818/g.335532 Transcript_119818/m.335532 type:complete len:84 (+) Transcript_119818:376-627(+)